MAVALVTAVALGPATAPAGAASSSTAALQVALGAVGLSPGPVDGIAGPRTQRALRAFQHRKRLAADGVPGPRTRHALGRRGRPTLGSRPLRSGQRGWDVAALQFLLHTRGFGPDGFDGGFGPNTRDAVVRYQRAAGLSVDGVAGPATISALRHRRVPSSGSGSSGSGSSGSGSSGTVSTGSPSGSVAFLRPVPGGWTDGFGWVGGRRHTGLDFPEAFGTPVNAAGVGTVTLAQYTTGGYGNLVVVQHRLGYETWYAHLSRFAVSVGQSVAGGSRIGYVGSTGRSTGPHLHFEVRLFGTPINPVPQLLSAVSATARHRIDRPLHCRPNADAWGTRDADPATARIDRCP
ncbi:peptidoglycan DD-metalloendopeptidase family protein [Conexibacter sp. CPCC 206217]|uniref:peptidoglycan DD-metalloendopeptidase family protein n=1 Tax=Conexibacter sp. CPCC 206217 TaxID=3064574 RepID=UPI002723EB9B|nr:peptidoglycan DD-metalloendopeptidase family protein [Conexibacter sp. CPCC 206217]MDO8211725.1 peptidoglycan DD-metalloendopeptidase family protein [Conexibacter sp. CPCC 206217]